jgi:hypothetical protein
MICLGHPFPEKRENVLAMFNELMISFYLYLTILLTDFNERGLYRDEFSFGLLGIVFFSVLVNVSNTLGLIIAATCKKWCLRMRRRRIARENARKYVLEHQESQVDTNPSDGPNNERRP